MLCVQMKEVFKRCVRAGPVQCVWEHIYVGAHVWMPLEPEEGVRTLGAGVVGSCEAQQNSGPWQEQPVLLAVEQSVLTVFTSDSKQLPLRMD